MIGSQSSAQTPTSSPDDRVVGAPFFLVGSERSGTTMLRLMLDHHPDIACMQESDFIVTHYDKCQRAPVSEYAAALPNDWLWRRSGLEFPTDAADYQACVRAFIEQRRRATGKRVGGATVLNQYHHLPALFPDARYVHLLRDGRPVAASIVNMGWAGNLFVGAQRWRDAVNAVVALQQRIPSDRWNEVRYEQLLADPPAQLARICRFLGLDYDATMLAYNADTTYQAPEPSNADRWRTKLSPREIQLAELAAGDLLDRMGYSRAFPPASPGAIRRLLLALDSRYRRTCFRCRRYGVELMLARWFWRCIGVRRPRLEARFEAIGESHIK